MKSYTSQNTQKRISLSWLKYFGFLGFLGFTYFIDYDYRKLSAFIFFSFFRVYFIEKSDQLKLDATIREQANKMERIAIAVPVIVCMMFANGYWIQQPYVQILSILAILCTFLGSAMISYYYAKSQSKKQSFKKKCK